MLAAYYDRTCDSRALFSDLKIASDETFEKHLNKYDVIFLDMTIFINSLNHILNISDLQKMRLKAFAKTPILTLKILKNGIKDRHQFLPKRYD
jgi:hypothetical protein